MLLLAALGYSARNGINGVGGELNTAVNVTARKIALVGDLRADFQNMQAFARHAQFAFVVNHMVQTNQKVGASVECSMCHTLESRQTNESELGAIAASVKRSIAQLRPLAATPSRNKIPGGRRERHRPVCAALQSISEACGAESIRRGPWHPRDQMSPIVDQVDHVMTELREQQRNRSNWRTGARAIPLPGPSGLPTLSWG